MSEDDPYVYPGTTVLRNKFSIRDAVKLVELERNLVVQRSRERTPSGHFDLDHLKAVHRHLFQDVYDWAGEIRTVEIAKDSSQFIFRQFIDTGMADVHRRLIDQKFLRRTTPEQFASAAGEIIGDVNHVHPFRDGNGRTQLIYLKQLGRQAGHEIDLSQLDRHDWIVASKAANLAEYGLMADQIFRAIA